MKQIYRSSIYVLAGLALVLLLLNACKKETADTSADPGPPAYRPDMQRLETAFDRISTVSGNAPDSALLIDGNDNKLFFVRKDGENLHIAAAYDISPSKYGYGAARGSNQTPWGVHRIAGKYGEGQPAGMCFFDRRPTGEIAVVYKDTTDLEEDPVTSRIIWLEGREDINRTSYWRFIYIHGTNEEGLIGTPQSKGCIRMKNDDVIELFTMTDTGMYVNIIRPEDKTNTEEE